MSETATLDAPEVVTPAVPPAPAAPEASAATFEKDSAQVLPDVLSKLTPAWSPPKMVTRGAPAAIAPVTAPESPAAPAAPVEAAPVVETPAPETPAAAPEPAKNWRMHAEDAKEALLYQLRKSGVPIKEAYAEVYGEPAAAATPAAPEPISTTAPEAADPVALADQQITSIAEKVAELEAQIDEAAESDPKAALKLTRQQNDLKIELSDAKKQRDQVQREMKDREVLKIVDTHRQLEDQSLSQMYASYPKLGEKTSDERAQFNLKVAELEKDPAFGPKFRDMLPGWPLMVARMVDAEKGWSRTPAATAPVAQPPAAPTRTPMNQPNPNPLAPSPVPPVRATSAAVITPSSNPGSTTPVANAETFWKESANVTPDELIKLMGHAPIDPRLMKAQRNDPRRFGGS